MHCCALLSASAQWESIYEPKSTSATLVRSIHDTSVPALFLQPSPLYPIFLCVVLSCQSAQAIFFPSYNPTLTALLTHKKSPRCPFLPPSSPMSLYDRCHLLCRILAMRFMYLYLRAAVTSWSTWWTMTTYAATSSGLSRPACCLQRPPRTPPWGRSRRNESSQLKLKRS